ncbi:hypothetical protein [Roseofilum capinflatum]|uniref:Glycosyl transferase n=1 Tax=Roseofilum capinflatum BLCC-M114 TaxID=3022440 RepID=A0ABT7B0G9_9CYAN|nr:hypothetical protein [Roseofilum capinflatum]MDJ1172667.1 hypothetical protein [Roseofilum capinflatum BLCC-M114]
MRYFCTYFDHNYLPKGLALYQSLQKFCGDFELWVLCLSRICYDALQKLNYPNVHLIPLDKLERSDPDLLRAKQNRTIVEYYFTCTPCLPLYVLRNNPQIDLLTYLDSDLFFYSDLQPIYQEIGDRSIAIIEHRFSPDCLELKQFGIYNVGWLSFRADQNALNCLQWWRERCIEWCYDRPEPTRFADQKYLDDWLERFSGVVVIHHKGANVSHWNTNNYQIHKSGNNIFVDELPLIFFHFHGFKSYKKGFEISSLNPQFKLANLQERRIFEFIYSPYIKTLKDITHMMGDVLPGLSIHRSLRGAAIPALSSL